MKKSIFRLLFTAIFALGFTAAVFSQDKKTIYYSSLWIKGREIKAQTNSSPKSQEELNKLFNFNSFVDFPNDSISRKYKKIINKKSSLFVVYLSKEDDEKELLSIERGVFKANLTNKKMICDKEVVFKNENSKTGIIVSYLFDKNSLAGKKKGNLTFSEHFFENKKNKNQLAELIYIPRAVSSKERKIIESYLAIKYGISLNEDAIYYNSKSDTIWNGKENEGFTQRVTGIGKDTLLGLNQKQSKNSKNDGLTIGLNKIKKSNIENDFVLEDKSFLIWGDNGKKVFLEANPKRRMKTMSRVWKMQTSSSKTTIQNTQIIIDKGQMTLEHEKSETDSDFMWLAVDSLSTTEFNYENAKYIKATLNNEKNIVFDNIKLNSNSNYLFTIVKAAEITKEQNTVPLENSISVLENTDLRNGNYVVFPNPVNKNENFSIQFNLNQYSNVSIQITDINGKTIKTKDLGSIDKYLYKESLPISGTYWIIVSINGKIETKKIIVQ